MLYHDRAPRPGEVMRFPDIANTFKRLVELGKPGFYTGPVAESIVELVKSKSGVMALEDLASHESDFVTPLSYTYNGVTLHEVCPSLAPSLYLNASMTCPDPQSALLMVKALLP